jgi:metal-responsive CopG/Arc/MetJ family transcriptional regulator
LNSEKKEEYKRMKRLNMTISHELHDRWDKVSKKIGVSKSAMLRDMLDTILPILEEKEVSSMVKMLLSTNGDVLKDLSKIIK